MSNSTGDLHPFCHQCYLLTFIHLLAISLGQKKFLLCQSSFILLSTFGESFSQGSLKAQCTASAKSHLPPRQCLQRTPPDLWDCSDSFLAHQIVHEGFSFLPHCIYQKTGWYECQSNSSCSFPQGFWKPFKKLASPLAPSASQPLWTLLSHMPLATGAIFSELFEILFIYWTIGHPISDCFERTYDKLLCLLQITHQALTCFTVYFMFILCEFQLFF